MHDPLVIPTDEGLYCPAGNFHIDPWRPVATAVITHAHLFPAWQARHRAVSMEAVVGNHDRHAAGVELGIRWHEHLDLGPFCLRHEPEPVAGRHVLAGHLHPVLTLQVAADRLRAPVFWFRDQVSVLPSFGSLTGGWDLPRKPPGQTVLVVEGELFQGPD